jgi:hypothetical protein
MALTGGDITSNAGALQPSSTALAAAGRSGGSRAVWCAASGALRNCPIAPRRVSCRGWLRRGAAGGRTPWPWGRPEACPFFTPALTTRGGAQATLTLCLLFTGTMADAETADLQVGGKSPLHGQNHGRLRLPCPRCHCLTEAYPLARRTEGENGLLPAPRNSLVQDGLDVALRDVGDRAGAPPVDELAPQLALEGLSSSGAAMGPSRRVIRSTASRGFGPRREFSKRRPGGLRCRRLLVWLRAPRVDEVGLGIPGEGVRCKDH